jgi:shikimate kinase
MRQWEQEALYECQNLQNTVISLGGGTPCFFDNLNFIQNNGIAVYLKMPAKMLMSRLLHSKTDRPLLQGKSKSELLEYVQQQLGERERYYLRAHLIFPASSPQVSELSQLIKNFQSENISK